MQLAAMYGLRRSLLGLRTLSYLRSLQSHELGRGVSGSGQIRRGKSSLGWMRRVRWPRWRRATQQSLLVQGAAASELEGTELSIQEEEVNRSLLVWLWGCGLMIEWCLVHELNYRIHSNLQSDVSFALRLERSWFSGNQYEILITVE